MANQFRKLVPHIVLAGMALGTAWAIRGSFGHEQGAAWAGAIGGLAIILLSKRADWQNNFFKAALASAAGWGIGGIISYGLVVGYGRGIDFGNVYYGFTMLFVIGGLFGWIGGGLFGLALSDRADNPVPWHSLIVEMVAGGLLFYFFIVREFEWLMTPPRGEEWAACLGMAVAMTWFLFRNNHRAPVRVAFFAAMGAGFGFAFGNFLQVMGQSAGIEGLNLWNVMEYSIGFFGGAGMAYAVFTSNWDRSVSPPAKQQLLLPLLLIILVIPAIVWDQSFNPAHNDPGDMVSSYIPWLALAFVLFFFGIMLKRYFIDLKTGAINFSSRQVFSFFLAYLILYLLFHLLNANSLQTGLSIEQVLYLLNLAVLWFFLPKMTAEFSGRPFRPANWLVFFCLVLGLLALLALLAIQVHGPLPGMQKRFP